MIHSRASVTPAWAKEPWEPRGDLSNGSLENIQVQLTPLSANLIAALFCRIFVDVAVRRHKDAPKKWRPAADVSVLYIYNVFGNPLVNPQIPRSTKTAKWSVFWAVACTGEEAQLIIGCATLLTYKLNNYAAKHRRDRLAAKNDDGEEKAGARRWGKTDKESCKQIVDRRKEKQRKNGGDVEQSFFGFETKSIEVRNGKWCGLNEIAED
ncbi:hypothetical protein L596_028692 [Steinernema carpocapsae]|uniref:Uncharacterized protein n=1 Tax=Steinernema carpocapsae TaxID=34508 RepID=A0A4U5LZ53_STECR|nr:hypothetical protein L596_028692 [Steinernema carpocapsae]